MFFCGVCNVSECFLLLSVMYISVSLWCMLMFLFGVCGVCKCFSVASVVYVNVSLWCL